MTESEIQCLKDSIDKLVEIETAFGERLIAKVIFVMHSEEYNEHDVQYQMISTSMPEAYATAEDYVLDFDDIVTVKPHLDTAAES
jgi:hypothetical protein